MTTKEPGLDGGNRHTELDLTYKKRFSEAMSDMPDAYERLILDVIRGDHNLFVRADELAAAWRIFTPLLHAIEKDKALKPIKYAFGSRGPPEADQLIESYGFIQTKKYSWEPSKSPPPAHHDASSSSSSSSRSEPEVLLAYVKAVESSGDDRAQSFTPLFASDATIVSPLFNGEARAPQQFLPEWLESVKAIKFLNQHKLIDPSRPTTFALYFSASGTGANGAKVSFDAMDLVELTEQGDKIKQITMFADPRKLGSKL